MELISEYLSALYLVGVILGLPFAFGLIAVKLNILSKE
jgi:hypothetical protein